MTASHVVRVFPYSSLLKHSDGCGTVSSPLVSQRLARWRWTVASLQRSEKRRWTISAIGGGTANIIQRRRCRNTPKNCFLASGFALCASIPVAASSFFILAATAASDTRTNGHSHSGRFLFHKKKKRKESPLRLGIKTCESELTGIKQRKLLAFLF